MIKTAKKTEKPQTVSLSRTITLRLDKRSLENLDVIRFARTSPKCADRDISDAVRLALELLATAMRCRDDVLDSGDPSADLADVYTSEDTTLAAARLDVALQDTVSLSVNDVIALLEKALYG